ncbi:MAG: PAS domain S-box protein [Clostridia bacterium]
MKQAKTRGVIPRVYYGQVINIVGARRDITDLKRIEKELSEREEQYRSLFENNHAVMLLIEPETGQLVTANPAACKFYGYTKQELTKMKITDINILDEEQVQKEMESARNEKRSQFSFRQRLANDEIRDVEVYSGPIAVKGKQLLNSIIHDITVRKTMEKELEYKNNELSKLVKEIESTQMHLIQQDKMAGIGQLAAGVAHEIKYHAEIEKNLDDIPRIIT